MAGSLPIFVKAFMKILLSTALVLFSLAGHAQLKGFSLGPYAEMATPTAGFKDTHKNGYGAGIGADIRLGKIGLTGSVGYIHFEGKSVFTGETAKDYSSVKAVPLRVGLKYRFIPALYAKLESGVARFTGGDESAFIFSPGIGVRVLGLDIQAKYELWKADQTYSFLGLKAGFNF